MPRWGRGKAATFGCVVAAALALALVASCYGCARSRQRGADGRVPASNGVPDVPPSGAGRFPTTMHPPPRPPAADAVNPVFVAARPAADAAVDQDPFDEQVFDEGGLYRPEDDEDAGSCEPAVNPEAVAGAQTRIASLADACPRQQHTVTLRFNLDLATGTARDLAIKGATTLAVAECMDDAFERGFRVPRACGPGSAELQLSFQLDENAGDAVDAEFGTLRINSRPWSRLYLGNTFIGNTPQLDIPLAAGSHRITLHNPDFDLARTLEVTVAHGETVTRVETLYIPDGGR